MCDPFTAYEWFTDGSKYEEVAGSGVWGYGPRKRDLRSWDTTLMWIPANNGSDI